MEVAPFMDIVPYAGWERCAKLSFNGLELIVTLDVGPRVIHFGFEGDKNEFAVHDDVAGRTGDPEFHSYGGHRLWMAPEDGHKIGLPDNDPISFRDEDGWTVFVQEPDKWHIQKEIWIRKSPVLGGVDVHHRLYNRGAYPVELALWGLTQMATGGELVVPQPEFIPWTEKLLPARPLVLWGYTDMSDSRYTWGQKVVRLRQDESKGPTKFGALVQQGYAAYANHGNVFIKRFGFEEGASYPDFNSNFESYTRHDTLEVESLGPNIVIPPREWRSHDESWYLVANETPPEQDDECAKWLAQLASLRPLHKFGRNLA